MMTLARDCQQPNGPLHVVDEIRGPLCKEVDTLCGLTLECPRMVGYPEGRDTWSTLARMLEDKTVCPVCAQAEWDAYQDDLSMDFD